MLCYRCFGLNIASDVHLPGFASCEGPADAVIAAAPVWIPPEARADIQRRYVDVAPDRVVLAWPGIASFSIKEGREVLYDRDPGVEDMWFLQFLLGMVLGVLLHQRQGLTLHASTVRLAGGAVLLAGAKGQGKSTMSGALMMRGNALLSDDLTLLCEDGDAFTVLPGIPQLKLWPDAAAALKVDEKGIPLHEGMAKRLYQASVNAEEYASPLAGVFILSTGDSLELEPLPPRQRISELLPHVYAPRILGPSCLTSDKLAFVAKMVMQTDVYRLTVPRCLDELPDAAAAIESRINAGRPDQRPSAHIEGARGVSAVGAG